MEIPQGDTYHVLFTSRQYSDGAPTVLAGTPTFAVYEENTATPIQTAQSVTVSVNSVVGLNRASIVATSGNGYDIGSYYSVVLDAGTVGGTTVVGEVIAHFRLVPVEDAGAGIRDVNVTHFGDTAATTAAGRPEVNTSHVGGTSQTANDMSGDVNTILTRVGANNLNTTATGNIGIDWANVENATSIVNLSATNIDVDQVVASVSGNVDGVVTGANDIAAGDVWAVDATTQQTQGTFGQAIGDPVADTTTIYQAVATDAAGDNVSIDVAAVKAETALIVEDTGTTIPGTITTLQADTDDIQTRIPAALVGGAMDCDVSAMQAGVVTAAAIATDAIDADALAASAVDEFWDEAMTETTGAPAVTGTFRDAIKWMFALSRNKITQTSTTTTLRNDADGADLATSTVSDDATTYTRGEWST